MSYHLNDPASWADDWVRLDALLAHAQGAGPAGAKFFQIYEKAGPTKPVDHIFVRKALSRLANPLTNMDAIVWFLLEGGYEFALLASAKDRPYHFQEVLAKLVEAGVGSDAARSDRKHILLHITRVARQIADNERALMLLLEHLRMAQNHPIPAEFDLMALLGIAERHPPLLTACLALIPKLHPTVAPSLRDHLTFLRDALAFLVKSPQLESPASTHVWTLNTTTVLSELESIVHEKDCSARDVADIINQLVELIVQALLYQQSMPAAERTLTSWMICPQPFDADLWRAVSQRPLQPAVAQPRGYVYPGSPLAFADHIATELTAVSALQRVVEFIRVNPGAMRCQTIELLLYPYMNIQGPRTAHVPAQTLQALGFLLRPLPPDEAVAHCRNAAGFVYGLSRDLFGPPSRMPSVVGFYPPTVRYTIAARTAGATADRSVTSVFIERALRNDFLSGALPIVQSGDAVGLETYLRATQPTLMKQHGELLLSALEANSSQMVRSLISRGMTLADTMEVQARAASRAYQWKTPQTFVSVGEYLVRFGTPGMLTMVLEAGSDPNQLLPQVIIAKRVRMEESTLVFLAARENREDVITTLARFGLDLDYLCNGQSDHHDVRPWTALSLALSSGNEQVAMLLLKLGANPWLPLTRSSPILNCGRADIAECLIVNGVDPEYGPTAIENYSPFRRYVATANAEVARVLLNYGATYQNTVAESFFPLFAAGISNSLTMQMLLLDVGYRGALPLGMGEVNEDAVKEWERFKTQYVPQPPVATRASILTDANGGRTVYIPWTPRLHVLTSRRLRDVVRAVLLLRLMPGAMERTWGALPWEMVESVLDAFYQDFRRTMWVEAVRRHAQWVPPPRSQAEEEEDNMYPPFY